MKIKTTCKAMKGILAKVSPDVAEEIAAGSGGNVRAALLDAQTHLDYKMFA